MWDDDLDQCLPETRCAPCLLRLLIATQDGGRQPDLGAQLIRPLNHTMFSRFSFKQGAKPLPVLDNSVMEGSKAFVAGEAACSEGTLQHDITLVIEELNRRRVNRDGPNAVQLDVQRCHPYSRRHGAAKNFKRLKVDDAQGARMLRMSLHQYLRTYGEEGAVEDGDNPTGFVAGCSGDSAGALSAALRADGLLVSRARIEVRLINLLNKHLQLYVELQTCFTLSECVYMSYG